MPHSLRISEFGIADFLLFLVHYGGTAHLKPLVKTL
jgi:hypothetical protein